MDEISPDPDSLLLRMQKIHAIKAPTKRNQSSLWKLVNNTQSQVSLETEASSFLNLFKNIMLYIRQSAIVGYKALRYRFSEAALSNADSGSTFSGSISDRI